MSKAKLLNSMFLTDGYKLDHRRQYPKGTEYIQANWTPRSNTYLPEATDGAVVFGVRYAFKYIVDHFNTYFFSLPSEMVIPQYKKFVEEYLQTEFDVQHLYDLYTLGYLPVEVKGLPEGTMCPVGIPVFTIVNTDPKFFWIVNYLETLISNLVWMPMTSATIARLYKKELYRHFKETIGYKPVYLDFCCHDFSMRGMSGLEATISSGMGHLAVWNGSESIPAIIEMEKYYGKCHAGTVPATEHSVMCAGSKEGELETFERLITETYPKGIVSIVSDTWDLWKVVTEYLPQLKDKIMARDGRLVVRPDSGDPVKIICGDPEADKDSPEFKGVYELLWDNFGGGVENGYKVLDTHVGVIYGDSITLDRQKRIYEGLERKGFVASNLVLGIGSYTYQYVTRDSLGFAMKSTWCQINGKAQKIFKNPVTDTGTKKSATGYLDVVKENGELKLVQNDVATSSRNSEYITYVLNGKLRPELEDKNYLAEIKHRIDKTLKD